MVWSLNIFGCWFKKEEEEKKGPYGVWVLYTHTNLGASFSQWAAETPPQVFWLFVCAKTLERSKKKLKLRGEFICWKREREGQVSLNNNVGGSAQRSAEALMRVFISSPSKAPLTFKSRLQKHTVRLFSSSSRRWLYSRRVSGQQ